MGLIDTKRNTLKFVIDEEFKLLDEGRFLINDLSKKDVSIITELDRRDVIISKFKKLIKEKF